MKKVPETMVSTASGLVVDDEGLTMEVQRLNGLLQDVMILPDSPALMSAGSLQNEGFSFHWSYGFLPCLVSNGDHKIIAFDVIEVVEDEDQLSFNFTIISTPDEDLSVNDLTLQEFTGRILTSLLEVAVSDGTLVAQDKETNEIMATDEMHEEMELYNEEHQSGTDDTEESVNQ